MRRCFKTIYDNKGRKRLMGTLKVCVCEWEGEKVGLQGV